MLCRSLCVSVCVFRCLLKLGKSRFNVKYRSVLKTKHLDLTIPKLKTLHFPAYTAKAAHLSWFPLCLVFTLCLCEAVFVHTCIQLSVHACVCAKACVNLLRCPFYCFLELLWRKSSWFVWSPRVEPHTQQMFHWKGHECLIICVIDATFLFVRKCEQQFDSVYACVYLSVYVWLRENKHCSS